MKYSFDATELVEELERDIDEFGNIDMYAFFEKMDNQTFLTNYDFIVEEAPLNKKDFSNNCTIRIMKAKDILKIIIKQAEIY